MTRRRKRRSPFAAYAALTFNLAICVAPFLAAKAVVTAYSAGPTTEEAAPETLAATRDAIEARFARIAASKGPDAREAWAELVRAELETGDIAAVNGLLLAAPAMLEREEAAALQARIAVMDGSGDEAVIQAAAAYLPEDVQIAYERRATSLASLFQNSASDADPQDANPVRLPGPDVADDRAEFSTLGDLRDLALMAARWAREDRFDEFAFVLSGVGLVLADPEAREGASVLMSARRADRLDPDFALSLERKLFQAAPPQKLKRMLEAEFEGEYGYATNGPAVVESVFREGVDAGALASLLRDLRVIQDIAEHTSPASAVAILSQVRNAGDLNRARLVADAGGDRAVALAKYDGAQLLDAARTVVRWTLELRLQLAAFLLCLGVLIAVALHVFWRSVRRNAPVRRSAIYALEEAAPH
jgi:hypothetical protein